MIEAADLPAGDHHPRAARIADAPSCIPHGRTPHAESLQKAGFTEREAAEIAALCATGFRVGEAEALLGYSSKSRTFSHRLRGLCLKALSLLALQPRRMPAGCSTGPIQRSPRSPRGGCAPCSTRSPSASHDAPDKVLTNLLTEHRRYALEALAYLRKR